MPGPKVDGPTIRSLVANIHGVFVDMIVVGVVLSSAGSVVCTRPGHSDK